MSPCGPVPFVGITKKTVLMNERLPALLFLWRFLQVFPEERIGWGYYIVAHVTIGASCAFPAIHLQLFDLLFLFFLRHLRPCNLVDMLSQSCTIGGIDS